jgi:hypothetical protein
MSKKSKKKFTPNDRTPEETTAVIKILLGTLDKSKMLAQQHRDADEKIVSLFMRRQLL